MRKLCLVILLLAVVLCGNELGELLREAEENHPLILAERALLEQLYQKHEELREFLDPTLFGAAGGASQLRALPASPADYATVGVHDALEAQGGVLIPVEGGAYVSLGGAFRRWFNPDDGYDSMYQHLLGLKMSVPLLRDRGFALYGHRRTAALAEYHAGVSGLLAATQLVRRDVELAYIALCSANANSKIRQVATERFQKIYEEARELARLKTIPEYQVQTALRDLQTGLEDQVAAEQGQSTARVALASAVGCRELAQNPACDIQEFLQAAMELQELPTGDVQTALKCRGDYQALEFQKEVAMAQIALEDENRKDQLTLNLGATWQGDSQRAPISAYRDYTDHNWGGEIMVVWTRPLDYTGTTARQAAAAAKIDELDARMEALAVQITCEVRTAQLRFQAAQRRLGFARDAVEAATATLNAEQERFRLGEGTSTIVLDAQKELNSILLRQSAAAAELLAAHAELQYALGYPEQ